VGDYQIVLVKIFADFPGFNPYSPFSLTVKPVVIAPVMKQPPFFEAPLEPQTVEQCLGPKTEFWSYQLPKIMDPNNSIVDLKIQFDNSFFAFDETEQKISQIKST
jgi:hypothetical protein